MAAAAIMGMARSASQRHQRQPRLYMGLPPVGRCNCSHALPMWPRQRWSATQTLAAGQGSRAAHERAALQVGAELMPTLLLPPCLLPPPPMRPAPQARSRTTATGRRSCRRDTSCSTPMPPAPPSASSEWAGQQAAAGGQEVLPFRLPAGCWAATRGHGGGCSFRMLSLLHTGLCTSCSMLILGVLSAAQLHDGH